MIKDPIFIMSSERSGSNLLRVLLGNHSNLASPVSPQLLTGFANASRYYAPLYDKKNAERLFNEILNIVNHDYHGWNLKASFDEFYKNGEIKSFFDFFDFFYSEKSKTEGSKNRFVCKENAIFDYAFPLKHHYPDAKFLYLYRDPRDYAASWMKVPLGFETPEQAVQVWVSEQRRCDILVNAFGLECIPVKYEELITNTELVMTRILEFIGEPLDVKCFSTDQEKNKEYSWNTYWKNLEKPVMKDNFGNFQKTFDEDAIRMIELTCKEFMLRLGYQPLYNFEPPVTNKNLISKVKSRLVNKTKKKSIAPDSSMQLLKDRQDLTKSILKNAQQYFNNISNQQ